MSAAVGEILRTADGIELASRRWQAPSASAVVVLVHGFTGRIDHVQVTDLADTLCGRGLGVLAFDSRGHGQSGGLCTLGDLERHDVAAAVAEARTTAERVVVVGASIGGVAALRYAAEDPDLAGVVTVSSPATWAVPRTPRSALAAVLTQTTFGRAITARWLGTRVLPEWHAPEPPIDVVPRLSTPLAVVHGARDDFVRPFNAQLMYDAASDPRRLWIVPRMGHGFGPRALPAVLDAVDWCLLMDGLRDAASATPDRARPARSAPSSLHRSR